MDDFGPEKKNEFLTPQTDFLAVFPYHLGQKVVCDVPRRAEISDTIGRAHFRKHAPMTALGLVGPLVV